MVDGQPIRPAYGTARLSPQRVLIARVASRLGGTFTVHDLAAAVREADRNTGLATVYRAVSALEAAGTIQRVGEKSGRALYLYCELEEHHHHLVCTGCGRVAATPCPVRSDAIDAAQESGFRVTGHQVTLFGLCADCLRAREGD